MIGEDGTLRPTAFQARVLAIPEEFDLFLGGGRGGGKSVALALLALRHMESHGSRARCLYLRQTYASLEDFAAMTRELFGAIYGREASFNGKEGLWRLPNGATLELAMLADPAHYQRYQGRSFSWIAIDECGQYADPQWLDRLRSNLRAPKGVPTRFCVAANPGGPGHIWLSNRFVNPSKPWEPFEEKASGRMFVSCPSTFKENEHIDQADYERNLEASVAGDSSLLRAWVDGDWSAASAGAFFGGCVTNANRIEPWEPADFKGLLRVKYHQSPPSGRVRVEPIYDVREPLEPYLAMDYGSSAPAVIFLAAKSPGITGPDGRWYPRGSVLLLDELHTAEPGSWSQGLGWTVDILAEAVRDFAKQWGVSPTGVADDACFGLHGHSAGSIADEFREHGVYWSRAQKRDRRSGWERMRRMLAAAGTDAPALYVSWRCAGFWQTVPYLPRDPRKPDDCDSRAADHWADACRYSLTAESWGSATFYIH